MMCPGCGRESISDSIFCTYCGVKMRPDVPLDSHLLDDDRRTLREAISGRRSLNRPIPPWIVVVPFAINIIITIIMLGIIMNKVFSYDLAAGDIPTQEELMEGLGWVFVLSLVGNVTFYVFYAMIAYLLIRGWNRHLDREKKAWDSIFGLVRKIQGTPSSPEKRSLWDDYDTMRGPPVHNMKRNPAFWALVIVVPLLGLALQNTAAIQENNDLYEDSMMIYLPLALIHAVLLLYMLHLLTSDILEHHRDTTDSAMMAKVALARAGVTAGRVEEGTSLPVRSSALYVIASILTLGIFLVYWWYSVIKDANTHYEQQARFEDQLLQLLSAQTSGARVTSV